MGWSHPNIVRQAAQVEQFNFDLADGIGLNRWSNYPPGRIDEIGKHRLLKSRRRENPRLQVRVLHPMPKYFGGMVQMDELQFHTLPRSDRYRLPLPVLLGICVTGSTIDFDSISPGSNPGSPAISLGNKPTKL